MNLQDLRVGTRLWLAVGLFIAALVALLGFASLRASQSQELAEKALSMADTKIRLASRWSQMTEAAVGRSLVSAISADPVTTKLLNEANTKAIEKITELQKQLAELPQSDEEKVLTTKIADPRPFDIGLRMVEHVSTFEMYHGTIDPTILEQSFPFVKRYLNERKAAIRRRSRH